MKNPKNLKNNQIGGHIRRLRKKSKLTQSNVADVLGVSFQQIQKFERGENRIFAHQLFEICDEFQWDINEFRASELSVLASNS